MNSLILRIVNMFSDLDAIVLSRKLKVENIICHLNILNSGSAQGGDKVCYIFPLFLNILLKSALQNITCCFNYVSSITTMLSNLVS